MAYKLCYWDLLALCRPLPIIGLEDAPHVLAKVRSLDGHAYCAGYLFLVFKNTDARCISETEGGQYSQADSLFRPSSVTAHDRQACLNRHRAQPTEVEPHVIEECASQDAHQALIINESGFEL